MFRSLFGAGTMPSMLRGGLEEQMATQRGIAARVAQSTQVSSTQPFGEQLAAKMKKSPEIDMNREMASLADTNLRYEATAKMLNSAYAGLRSAIKSNG